ncbi:MAG TPA: penicillin-binding transpeptidase domain-containing protein [Pyrinomonadaceae bacterium]|jgi:beta-lactamase regulating signal transducer with metallopeptidase domain/beta-lactamase class D
MNLFELENLQPIFNALGWTLLHFLWQGTLIALLVRGALIFLRECTANARYLTLCAGLVLMLIFPVFTFGLFGAGRERAADVDEARLVKSAPRPAGYDAALASAPDSQVSRAATDQAVPRSESSLRARFESWLPWLVLLWFAGVLTLSARFLSDWLAVRRLKSRTARRLENWQPAIDELARRLGINRSVRLLESSLVKVPVAAGWLKPLILLPVGMVLNLTPRQVENIIAHELAHIRRHDYLVNIFQTFAEILLFYHPAVLWLSKQIRLEREYACDDLAVKACGGDAICYARALTKVERWRQAAPALATAATGGSLESRVRRLVDASHREHSASGFSAGLIFLLTLAVAAFGLQAALRDKTSAPVFKNAVVLLPDSAESIEPQAAETTAENPDLQTEIFAGEDENLRRIALAALGRHHGSVIIMNPKTGKLFTIVNQDLAFRREWNPASTFKLVTSLAALEENKIGANEKITVSETGEKLNLTDALAVSRNEYFAALGERVGGRKLLDAARRFGLGSPTGVNLPGEIAGSLPRGDTRLNNGKMGIYGQETKITPLQLAVLVSAFANDGTLVRPFAGETENEPQFLPALKAPPAALTEIVAGMRAAVEKGTGKGAFSDSFAVAGKTGTAKTGTDGVGLFASFAPVENPRFVVVVAIEEPEANGPAAAEIAGKIYAALGKDRFGE